MRPVTLLEQASSEESNTPFPPAAMPSAKQVELVSLCSHHIRILGTVP